jgi:hypothetical protein
MYTIFFIINCVEQLQFKQLIFFCLKVKLLKIHVRQMIFDFRPVDKKNDICSNGVEQMKNCVDQFFRANKFRAVDHDPFSVLSGHLFQTLKYVQIGLPLLFTTTLIPL